MNIYIQQKGTPRLPTKGLSERASWNITAPRRRKDYTTSAYVMGGVEIAFLLKVLVVCILC